MNKQDMYHAGEIIIASPAYVHCGWCCIRVEFAPTQSAPANWHFLAETYGWLCPFCYEIYTKGYTFLLMHHSFFYHISCAISHNIVPFSELHDTLVVLQQQRTIQKVKKNDFIIGYEIAVHQTCDICAHTFV